MNVATFDRIWCRPHNSVMRRRILLTVLLAIGLAACTSQSAPRPHRPSPSAPALTGQHACAGARAFNCSTLTVPLDYAGRVPGRLALRVAAERARAAPHGVLLLLTGGPGQPGVPFAERLARMLGQTISGYQLVLFDQRGTGAGALDCPALQREMGSSDLRVPTPDAVRACAAAIGPYRRFYATADVVADIDMLRRALRAPRLAVDGVSYGSYVAERYALAYRGRVSRLVLDSVVAQTGGDPFELANMQATAGVLRGACRVQRCSYDPAAD